MDPENRHLLRVKLDDAEQADKIIRRVLHTLKNMPRSTPMPKDTAATRATVHAVEHPWKRACASARNVVAP